MKIYHTILTVITLFVLIFPHSVTAQNNSLDSSIRSSAPNELILSLSNTGTEACQIVTIPEGTITVQSFEQNQGQIIPEPIQVGIDDSLQQMQQRNLKTLNPGETFSMPLTILPLENEHVLQIVQEASALEPAGLQYRFDSSKPYALEVLYKPLITPESGPPLCDNIVVSTGAASQNTFGTSISWWWFALALIVVIGIIIFIWKRKKHGKKAHVIVLFLVVPFLVPTSSYADYSMPESAASRFDECMATFERFPEITDPVLDALDSGRIVIHRTTGGVNYATDYPDGSYHIYWDPDSEYNYHSDGGAAIPSTPCDRLFHEMYHVYEMMNGTFSRDDCADSGIETKEVNATRAQNQLREALGLPPRTHYGTTPLPEGDCSEEPPEPSPPPCTGGCGKTTGDPHLTTFDQFRYSFQAVGEFILARNQSDTFEVQVRQQAWPNSRDASVNTSVAARVGTDIVELSQEDRKLVLYLNREQTTLEDQDLPDGGTLRWNNRDEAVVSWPDGSTLRVQSIGTFGLSVVVDPVDAYAGTMQGLLGNFNGNKEDDLRLGEAENVIEPEFDQLYPRFADAWRITDAESLFFYKDGTSTADYTDRSFPDKPITGADLPNRAEAEAACRNLGITDPVVLENCIFDVGITGQLAFATAALQDQQTTTTYTAGGERWNVTMEQTGDIAEIQFEAQEGEKVFIDMPTTTLKNQCGVFYLVGPEGNRLHGGCILNGQGMIDGTNIQAPGTYTIQLESRDEGRQTATIRLIRLEDQKGTIAPDGTAVTANISKPGMAAAFSFEGNAGDSYFIQFSNATLPNQCGGIGIQSPSGSFVRTGCILNGTGNVDRTTLREDGTHVVVVDPADRNLGIITLQLLRTADRETEATVNGSAVTVPITKPGSVGRIRFTGQAGQSIFVEFSQNTLPHQCGGFVIQDEAEKVVDSLCVLGKEGTFEEEGVVLPATGTYTVIVDPADENTGQITFQIRS